MTFAPGYFAVEPAEGNAGDNVVALGSGFGTTQYTCRWVSPASDDLFQDSPAFPQAPLSDSRMPCKAPTNWAFGNVALLQLIGNWGVPLAAPPGHVGDGALRGAAGFTHLPDNSP